MPTDVVVIGKPRRQAGFRIFMDGPGEGLFGTLTCFVSNSQGNFAASCAHCLGGVDGDLNNPKDVSINFPDLSAARVLGTTAGGEDVFGEGRLPNFGEFDAGVVRITGSAVLTYVAAREPLSVFRPTVDLGPAEISSMLKDNVVQGWGAGSEALVLGKVVNTLLNFDSKFYDMLIESSDGDGITRAGDSGLLWFRSSTGEALAVHTAGATQAENGKTLHALGFFVYRLADRFGGQLLTSY